MADTELKDFLRMQARSLNNLLALTPAKNMFGEDVSDQWKRKKQTPEQKRAARIAKLDPANWKSAKDVYDERDAAAKKRKREESEVDRQSPGAVQIMANGTESKRRKDATRESDHTTQHTNHERIENVLPDQISNPNFNKRMKKRQHAKEKKQHLLERKEQEKLARQHEQSIDIDNSQSMKNKTKKDSIEGHEAKITGAKTPSRTQKDPIQASKISVAERSNQRPEQQVSDQESSTDDASTAPSSIDVPEILSPTHDSASSSASSIQPVLADPGSIKKPTASTVAQKSSLTNSPSEEGKEAARKRLQDHISQLRLQRKADEKPARSRAELLEQRRQKEEEKKLAKKEQRRKERDEEARKQDEEMVRRFSPGGSGSLLASPRSPLVDDLPNGGFSFGRIAFEDGTHLDSSTLSAVGNQKHKGAADPATALKAAQSKAARISGFDEKKRQDIEEKEMWLKAKKRAHGERIRDDTSLLKKALKRQDKQKNRSEQEWDKRIEGVRSGQDAKQKKRSENLQKRKDENLAKKIGKKKVKRPGFEGSFRGRTGKKK